MSLRRPGPAAGIDHSHEHFAVPAVVSRGRYRAPDAPGASTEMRPEALAEVSYPFGPARLCSSPADP